MYKHRVEEPQRQDGGGHCDESVHGYGRPQAAQTRGAGVDRLPVLRIVISQIREVANLLRLHEKSVYALVARGAIPHVRLGRRVVFSQPELLRWLGARMEGK
jgi:excisionase family DNA binding protein